METLIYLIIGAVIATVWFKNEKDANEFTKIVLAIFMMLIWPVVIGFGLYYYNHPEAYKKFKDWSNQRGL